MTDTSELLLEGGAQPSLLADFREKEGTKIKQKITPRVSAGWLLAPKCWLLLVCHNVGPRRQNFYSNYASTTLLAQGNETLGKYATCPQKHKWSLKEQDSTV